MHNIQQEEKCKLELKISCLLNCGGKIVKTTINNYQGSMIFINFIQVYSFPRLIRFK